MAFFYKNVFSGVKVGVKCYDRVKCQIRVKLIKMGSENTLNPKIAIFWLRGLRVKFLIGLKCVEFHAEEIDVSHPITLVKTELIKLTFNSPQDTGNS